MFEFIKELFVEPESKIKATERSHYSEQGFVLLSHLIPSKTVTRARDAMRDAVREDGSPSRHVYLHDAMVLDCFTRSLCATAGDLAGFRSRPHRPRSVLSITVFPTTSPWQWPHPHLDHASETDAHRTFPLPYGIGCLIYLNDIPPNSGGTVVWPGSHRKLEAMVREHPQDYEYLYKLNREISGLDFGTPVQITASAGDVLFYHPLCAHGGSSNVGTAPRFALNHKW